MSNLLESILRVGMTVFIVGPAHRMDRPSRRARAQ